MYAIFTQTMTRTLVAVWILVLLCGVSRALDRSQIPSQHERDMLCETILVLRRQGYFAPLAQGKMARKHCMPVTPSLNQQVLRYLRDQLRANNRGDSVQLAKGQWSETGRLLYEVRYETAGERIVRINKRLACEARQQKHCHARYGDKGEDSGFVCFLLHVPPEAYPRIRDTLNCQYTV